MIIADTSAWIDFLNGVQASWVERLTQASRQGELVVGDLILGEILQGVRSDAEFRASKGMLLRFRQVDLCGRDIAVRAAENYRLLRRQGITIRGTIDVVIATWCIENGAEIIHNDRDLALMEDALGLVAYR